MVQLDETAVQLSSSDNSFLKESPDKLLQDFTNQRMLPPKSPKSRHFQRVPEGAMSPRHQKEDVMIAADSMTSGDDTFSFGTDLTSSIDQNDPKTEDMFRAAESPALPTALDSFRRGSPKASHEATSPRFHNLSHTPRNLASPRAEHLFATRKELVLDDRDEFHIKEEIVSPTERQQPSMHFLESLHIDGQSDQRSPSIGLNNAHMGEAHMIEARNSAMKIIQDANNDPSPMSNTNRRQLNSASFFPYDYSPRMDDERTNDLGTSPYDYSPRRDDARTNDLGTSPSQVDEATAVRKRNAYLLGENNDLKVRLAAAESKLGWEKGKIDNMNLKVESSEDVVKDLVGQIKRLEEELSKREALKEEVKKQLDEMEGDQRLTKKMFLEKMKKKDNTFKEMGEVMKKKFKEELEDRDKHLEALESSLVKRDEKIHSLRDEVSQLQSDMKHVKAKAEEDVERAKDHAQSDVENELKLLKQHQLAMEEDFSKQLEQKEAEKEELERELQARVDGVDPSTVAMKREHEEQLQEKVDCIDQLKRKLASQSHSIEDLEGEREYLVNEKKASKDKLAAKDGLIKDQERDIMSLQKVVEELTVATNEKDSYIIDLNKDLDNVEKSKAILEEELSDKLTRANEDNQKLKHKLQSLKEDHDQHMLDLEEELAVVREEKEKVQMELDKSFQYLEEEDRERRHLLDTIKRLEDANDTLSNDVSRLRTEWDAAERVMNESQSEIDELRKENRILREKFHEADQQYKEQSQQRMECQMKLDEVLHSSESQLRQLEKALKESEANVSCLKKELVKAESCRADLEKTISDQAQTIQSLRNEVHQVSSKASNELKDAIAEKEVLQLELRANARQIAQQEKEIETALNEVQEVRDRNGALEKESERQEEQLQECGDQNSRLERMLSAEERATAKLNDELRQLNSQLEETETALRRERAELTSRIEDAEDTFGREREALNVRIAEMRDEVRTLKEDLNITEERAALVPELNNVIRKTEDDLENLKLEYDALKRDSDAAVEELRQDIEALQCAHEHDSRAIDELEREKAHAEKAHRQEVSALEREVDGERRSMNTLRSEMRALTLKMEDTVAEYRHDKEMLQKKMTESTRRIQEHERYIDDLAKDLDACKAERDALQEDVVEMQKKVADANRRVREQERYIEALAEDMDNCKADRDGLNQHALALESDLADAETRLETAQADVNEANFRVAELERELRQNNHLLERVRDNMYNR